MNTNPLPDAAPFTDWMGVIQISSAQGEVVLQLPPRGEINNRRGVVHGGALATLLDSAMSRAARTLADGMELGGTIDLHVQFMQPATGTLTARGSVESSTRTLAFCRGEVRDEANTLVATGIATLRLRRPC
ncbi:MAG: PaaI family thioesterase [Pseudomonadota bacterium]